MVTSRWLVRSPPNGALGGEKTKPGQVDPLNKYIYIYILGVAPDH